MLKFNLLIVFSLIFCSLSLFAQQDTTKTDDEWDWHWDEWEDWTVDIGFNKSHPAISLHYGFAEMSRTDIQSQFVDPNLWELKLGYIKSRNAWNTENIIKHTYNYLYLSNESSKLAGKEAVGAEVESDMWRFGAAWSSGYGYKLGESSSIVPYYTYSLNWSDIDFTLPEDPTLPEEDIKTLNYIEGSFRFGTSSEGGVRFQIINNLMLDAGYERSIVFERHLFWKWAGSALIEAAAQGLLDGFINKIFKSSPTAGPVVNFLLKNALAYGIYELRQDEMNWPFPSAPSLAYDQFKVGMTFVF